MTLIYLDTETTGLDTTIHDVWEIAYAVDDGPILSKIVGHTLDGADPDALRIGGHTDRCNVVNHPTDPADISWDFEYGLQKHFANATLVGANPAFDAKFLEARWGFAPWKYRLFDIESYAMPALFLEEPKGLAYIAEKLGVHQPDHTARQDVYVLRECHRILRKHYANQVGILA